MNRRELIAGAAALALAPALPVRKMPTPHYDVRWRYTFSNGVSITGATHDCRHPDPTDGHLQGIINALARKGIQLRNIEMV